MNRKEAKIEEICRAALRNFSSYGYRKTTVGDVAAELGMTQSNLYFYVKDKRELYERAVSFALEQWQQYVREAVEKEEDVKQRFLVMCTKAVEYLTEDDELRRILAHDPDISMTVKLMRDFFRYGTVQMDVSKVIGFAAKKPVKRGYINGGVYILKANLFDRFDLPGTFSFESDFLEKYVSDLKISAMNCSDYFIDIGIPKDYEKARKELPGLIE